MGRARGIAGGGAMARAVAGPLAWPLGIAVTVAHHALGAARWYGAGAERIYAQAQSAGAAGGTCAGDAAVRLGRTARAAGGASAGGGGAALCARAAGGCRRRC